MAEAKIDIIAAVNSEGLKELNSALADGQQSVKAMKSELRDLEKETQNGTKATEAQAEALRNLQQRINEQTQVNQQYSKAIRDTQKSYLDTAKGAETASSSLSSLASGMLSAAGGTGVMSVALGGLAGGLAALAADIASSLLSELGDMVSSLVEAGAAAQETIAQFSAMKYNLDDAITSYRIFNDLTRDLTYDPNALNQMMVQLIDMGYSAKNAADLIRQCADTAAGLGQGVEGAQQLVNAIARIQATGELTTRQLVALKTSGLDLNAVFADFGMSGDEAMKAVEDGTISAEDAVKALSRYMSEFDGSMHKSKENINDAWGDLTGNLAACCEEIGLSIVNAFSQSEIVQKLIDFTQDLLDMIRSDGVSIFSDFRDIASYALSLVGDGLQIIINAIKLTIMAAHEMYAAFRSLGARIANALAPILEPLGQIWSILSNIVSALGHTITAGIDEGWSNIFPGSEDVGSEENHFRPTQRASSGTSGGGSSRSGGSSGRASSGGSVSKEEREEERQIDALIKKYTDADKQKQALAKSTLELAKANMEMLVGDNKKAEENKIALQALSDAHEKLMTGWENELVIAQKISNEETREQVIRSINDQIDAENKLYEAKSKAQEFSYQYGINKEDTKTLLDNILGTSDEVAQRIKDIKETLKENLEDIDVAMANPDTDAQLSGMAKLLQSTPDALEEELAEKGETLQAFADQYKSILAETAEAEIQQLSIGEQWSNKMKSYAEDVGKSMENSMTDFIIGGKSGGDALKEFAQNIIKNAISILAEWLSVFAIYSAFPMWASGMTPADAANKTVFGITKKAKGGLITGPGTGTSDSVPAMLSNGEYVIRSSAVDKIGVGALNAMNAGRVPEFSDGGDVGDIASGGNVTLAVSAMDASSFVDFLRNGAMDSIKQALFENTRDFTTESGVW